MWVLHNLGKVFEHVCVSVWVTIREVDCVVCVFKVISEGMRVIKPCVLALLVVTLPDLVLII